MFAEGIKPFDLLHLTWRDVLIILYGVRKRKVQDQRNIRSLVYAIHTHLASQKEQKSIYELMPLAGDPTREEIRRAAKLQEQREAEQMIIDYEFAHKIGRFLNTQNKATA